MKYILDNKSDSINSITENEITGLEIKSTSQNNILNYEKVTIVAPELKTDYIKQKLDKKIADLLYKMRALLEDPNSSDGDVALVLDEMEKLKGILINKYREHLEDSLYKSYLKKLMLTEDDFIKRYDVKKIYREMMMGSYEETQGKAR